MKNLAAQTRKKWIMLGVVGVVAIISLEGAKLTWTETAAAADSGEAVTAAYDEGVRRMKAGQLREAAAAFDKVIRLKPDFAPAYGIRANVYGALAQYERALADYNEAVRLDPAYVEAYFNRGTTYSNLGRHEQAIRDYSEVLRLNPDLVQAYYHRGLAYLTLGRSEAGADARAYLDRQGWRHKQSQYMALVAYFADLQAGREAAAREILNETASKGDTSVWPYPIIRFLRRELSTADLLAAAGDAPDKRTEAWTYLGLDFARANRRDYAERYLQWVKDKGKPEMVEHDIAVAELGRLAAGTSVRTAPLQPQPAASVQPQTVIPARSQVVIPTKSQVVIPAKPQPVAPAHVQTHTPIPPQPVVPAKSQVVIPAKPQPVVPTQPSAGIWTPPKPVLPSVPTVVEPVAP